MSNPEGKRKYRSRVITDKEFKVISKEIVSAKKDNNIDRVFEIWISCFQNNISEDRINELCLMIDVAHKRSNWRYVQRNALIEMLGIKDKLDEYYLQRGDKRTKVVKEREEK